MIPILDNGHGGLINGVYQTAGKRSPNWNLGILYEGVFNRDIVKRVATKLDRLSKEYIIIVPEDLDISLSERIHRINNIQHSSYPVYLVSIHANAGGGSGYEVFTSKGKTKSDDIANTFIEVLQKYLNPVLRLRKETSDGDLDKEENFYLLKKSNCPAILIEAAFMDNPYDYKLLFSEDFRNTFAEAITEAIIKLY